MKVLKGAKDTIKSKGLRGKLVRSVMRDNSKTGRSMARNLRKNGIEGHRALGAAVQAGQVYGAVKTALVGGAAYGAKKVYDKGRDMQERRSVKGRIKQTIRKQSKR